MGVSADDAVGRRTPAEVFGPGARSPSGRAFRALRPRGQDHRVRGVPGGRRRVAGFPAPSCPPILEDGRVCRLVGASGDVTDHRASEAALREHLRRSEVPSGPAQAEAGAPRGEFFGVRPRAGDGLHRQRAIGGIFLYDETSDRLVFQSARGAGVPDPVAGSPSSAASLDMAGIWGEAVRNGRPVQVGRQDTRTIPPDAEPGFNPPGRGQFPVRPRVRHRACRRRHRRRRPRRRVLRAGRHPNWASL